MSKSSNLEREQEIETLIASFLYVIESEYDGSVVNERIEIKVRNLAELVVSAYHADNEDDESWPETEELDFFEDMDEFPDTDE